MRFVIVLLLITPLSAQTNVSPCAPKIQKENALLQTALRDFATASRQLQMRLLEQPKRAKHFDKERMKTVEAYQRVSLQISHLDALHTKDQPECLAWVRDQNKLLWPDYNQGLENYNNLAASVSNWHQARAEARAAANERAYQWLLAHPHQPIPVTYQPVPTVAPAPPSANTRIHCDSYQVGNTVTTDCH